MGKDTRRLRISTAMFDDLVKKGRIKASELARCGQDIQTNLTKPINKQAQSKGETTLALHLELIGLEKPVREYQFVRDRKWRFDFAWPELKLAVEVEGIIHYGTNPDGSRKTSRHQTQQGYHNDCDKYNRAALEGWMVLRFTQKHIKSGEAVDHIQLLYNQKMKKSKPPDHG